MDYNFTGLKHTQETIFSGKSYGDIEVSPIKKEYYLTLSVVIEDQENNECMSELKMISNSLKEILKGCQEEDLHFYKDNEFHFSLVNFLTYNYTEEVADTFRNFNNTIENNKEYLLQDLNSKIVSTIDKYKIKSDFPDAKFGILHADQGSVATQVFLSEKMVKFCDELNMMANFPKTSVKIYPVDDSKKNRCTINILKIFNKRSISTDVFKKTTKEILTTNSRFLVDGLLDLRLKNIRLNISDPYLTQADTRYKLIKIYNLEK